MPKVAKQKKYLKAYSEDAIQKAIDAIENGLGQRQAAARFGVPRATLQFRLSSKFKKTSHGPNPILTTEEEALLKNWITTSCMKGFPRREQNIRESVKEFLDAVPRQNPFKNNRPGTGWYKGFLKRHPDIVLRTSEAITSASANVSEGDIKKWFKSVEQYLDQKRLRHILDDPKRIYNGDETNFMLCPKNKKVLAPRGSRNIYEIEHNPKVSLTVMFTFSASGETTPPMIIYPYKRMPQEIAKSVPKGWGIGCTESGWMTKESFYEYIGNVLYPYLKGKGVDFPIILFVDGHKTHMTFKLSKLCTDLDIILIALYPNSTRILQPADVAAFKPLKSCWKNAVVEFTRLHPFEVLTKEKFASVLEKAIQGALRPATVRQGFRACGLYPWDSSAIDFTKCLGKNKCKEITSKPEQGGCGILTFVDFKNICGIQTLEKFKNFDKYQIHNEDFLKLYNIYEWFQSKAPERQNENNLDYEQNIEEIDTEANNLENNWNTDLQASKVEVPCSFNRSIIEVFIKDCDNDNKNETDISDLISPTEFENCDGNIESILKTCDKINENLTNKEIMYCNVDENFDIHNMPIIIENDANSNISIEYINTLDETTEIGEGTNLNKTLDDFITWPKTPERKGRQQSEKLPFVITSTGWKKIYENKEKAKIDAAALKEKNKLIRLEKRQEKEAQKMLKKKKKLNEKKTRQKDIKHPKVLTPTYQRNKEEIKDKTKEIDAVKKQLFMNDNSQMINILSDISIKSSTTTCTQSSMEYKFKNPKIYEGLCFICCNNISLNRFGLTCTTCRRTYHISCIIKNVTNNKNEYFQCNTCTKKENVKEKF